MTHLLENKNCFENSKVIILWIGSFRRDYSRNIIPSSRFRDSFAIPSVARFAYLSHGVIFLATPFSRFSPPPPLRFPAVKQVSWIARAFFPGW